MGSGGKRRFSAGTKTKWRFSAESGENRGSVLGSGGKRREPAGGWAELWLLERGGVFWHANGKRDFVSGRESRERQGQGGALAPALRSGKMEVQCWDLGESRGSALGLRSLFPDGWPCGRSPNIGAGGLASWLFPQAGSALGLGGVEIWRQVASLSGGRIGRAGGSAAKEAGAFLSGGQSRG